jgi:hypothetical protein
MSHPDVTALTPGAAVPGIEVESIRRIYDDGAHNGFTDLCRFRDAFYLVFRSNPVSHYVEPGSTIVVLRSEDGRDWQVVYRWGVDGRDVRDPHLLVFRDKLWVLSGSWLCNGRNDLGEHLGHGVCSADGRTWDGPFVLEGTYGYYVWRCASFGGKAYLVGQTRRHVDVPGTRGRAEGRTVLFVSDDARQWKHLCVIENQRGNETAFQFEPDGRIVALLRQTLESSLLAHAQPPYQQWTLKPIPRYIGGPLLVKWDGHDLVGGRKFTDMAAPGHRPRLVLSWLVNDQLHDVVEFPTGGDTAYPGFASLGDGRALLSYYSSHEGSNTTHAPSHIYLAQIRKR